MKEQGIEYGGRYPAQTFIDDETAEILDKQSGVSKSTGGRIGNKGSELNMMGTNYEKGDAGYGDVAGCSKILHKCNFTDEELVYMDFENDSDCVWSELTNQWKDEKELKSWLDDYFMKDIIIDFNFKNYQRIIIDSDRKMVVPLLHKCDYDKADYDLYSYEPKVSGREREAGCKGFEKEQSSTGLDYRGRVLERDDGSKTLVTRFMREPSRNNHPTLKPISLNERILKLFKTPNDQKICYAFAGAGSEVIGGIKAGFDNWVACEINQEYVDIANARIKYWKETMTTQLDMFADLDLDESEVDEYDQSNYGNDDIEF